jgi:hypothetical protein
MRGRIVVGAIALAGILASPFAKPASADQPSASERDAKEKSRAAFRRGVAQLRAQDWAAARASFESAWALYPHPSILLNLGIARLRTDDPVLAEQDLVKFLSEDPGAAPEELAGAREALAEARSKIGTLRVTVTPASARVTVDGRSVETVRRAGASSDDEAVVAEVRAKAGRHAITIEAPGHEPAKREIDLSGKGEGAISVKLVPVESTRDVEPRSNGRAVVGWSLAGLSGAALITGGICALRAKSLADDYADPTSAGFQSRDTRSEGVTFRTTADVALVVGIVSAAGAILLLATDLGAANGGTVARRRPRGLVSGDPSLRLEPAGTVVRW